jgi:hypothetical protein
MLWSRREGTVPLSATTQSSIDEVDCADVLSALAVLCLKYTTTNSAAARRCTAGFRSLAPTNQLYWDGKQVVLRDHVVTLGALNGFLSRSPPLPHSAFLLLTFYFGSPHLRLSTVRRQSGSLTRCLSACRGNPRAWTLAKR